MIHIESIFLQNIFIKFLWLIDFLTHRLLIIFEKFAKFILRSILINILNRLWLFIALQLILQGSILIRIEHRYLKIVLGNLVIILRDQIIIRLLRFLVRLIIL